MCPLHPSPSNIFGPDPIEPMSRPSPFYDAVHRHGIPERYRMLERVRNPAGATIIGCKGKVCSVNYTRRSMSSIPPLKHDTEDGKIDAYKTLQFFFQ